MGALGELLELLHDAHTRLRTFEVEFQDWDRPRPTHELAVHRSENGKPQPRWRGHGPWPVTVLTKRRIWLEPPDRTRVEVLAGGELVRLAVRNGGRWWRWDAEEGEMAGSAVADERGRVTIPSMLLLPMLDVRRLVSMVTLEPTGVAERAGREVVCATAYPRVPEPNRPSLVYELEFDAEHGSLLRRAELAEDECVWERLAVEVIYDAEIDPNCFLFVTPDTGAN